VIVCELCFFDLYIMKDRLRSGLMGVFREILFCDSKSHVSEGSLYIPTFVFDGLGWLLNG
jgi:hypothetical protein